MKQIILNFVLFHLESNIKPLHPLNKIDRLSFWYSVVANGNDHRSKSDRILNYNYMNTLSQLYIDSDVKMVNF